jgi:hypothetical protein
MKLFCPDCGGPIPPADVNLDRLAAKCGRCGCVFGFADALAAEGPRSPSRRGGLAGGSGGSGPGVAVHGATVGPAASRSPQLPLLPRPRRFRVEEAAGAWRVGYGWFTPALLFLAFFCVAWDSFLVFWYSVAFTQRDTPWIMVVFPVAHVAVGVGLSYSTLAGFLNRTTIEAARGMVAVRHGPLPWVGNRTLRASDLAALYVEPNTLAGGAVTRNGQPSWQLSAALRDGTKVKLLGGFTDPAEPRYLERQLEARLRLPPRAVAGEVG